MSLKSPRKIDKMVISEDVSVQVDFITFITSPPQSPTTPIQMQKITMRFEEPPILEKEKSEKEQMPMQRQQMAAAGC